MRKMICALLALTLTLGGFAMAETVAPQFDTLDTNDGTYAVCFNRENLKDGALGDVEIYTQDIYDIVEVAQLAVGDTFVAEGKEVTVDTLETNEFDEIEINGGFEAENGYTLTPLGEDSNGWTTTMYDDYSTYTLRDTLSLELAEKVTLEDSWNIDAEPVTAEGIEAVTDAIMVSELDAFDYLNTEIRLEGGKIVEIIRRYNP